VIFSAMIEKRDQEKKAKKSPNLPADPLAAE
jgi:hypothetical protein